MGAWVCTYLFNQPAVSSAAVQMRIIWRFTASFVSCKHPYRILKNMGAICLACLAVDGKSSSIAKWGTKTNSILFIRTNSELGSNVVVGFVVPMTVSIFAFVL